MAGEGKARYALFSSLVNNIVKQDLVAVNKTLNRPNRGTGRKPVSCESGTVRFRKEGSVYLHSHWHGSLYLPALTLTQWSLPSRQHAQGKRQKWVCVMSDIAQIFKSITFVTTYDVSFIIPCSLLKMQIFFLFLSVDNRII